MPHFVTFAVKLSLRVALTGRRGPGGDAAVTFHFSDATQYTLLLLRDRGQLQRSIYVLVLDET